MSEQLAFAKVPYPDLRETKPRDLVLRNISVEQAVLYLAGRHYLGCAETVAHTATLRLGVYAGVPEALAGVLLWGWPTARCEGYPETTLELRRMSLLDALPRNSESRCLGLAAREIRRSLPRIKRLISYSDPARGHTGTIYRAAGWLHVGRTEPKHWSNRPGRADTGTAKDKWERIL